MPYTSLFQLGHCYYVATKISNKNSVAMKCMGGIWLLLMFLPSFILQVVWHAPQAQLPAPKLALKWPCSISSIVGTQEVSHDWDGLRGETGGEECALQWNIGIQCSDVLMNVSRITRSELMKKSSANDNKMTIPKTLDPNLFFHSVSGSILFHFPTISSYFLSELISPLQFQKKAAAPEEAIYSTCFSNIYVLF